MDGTIVHDQDPWTISRMVLNQMLQEGDEGFTITFVCHLVNHFIGNSVVGVKQMTPLLLTWRWNTFLVTTLHPTSDQDGQPA